MVLVVAPVWAPGYPWGSDTWGHLHRANYMLEALQTYGWVDGFFKSAWMTDWYMGDPTRVYYPPLTIWVLGGLSGLTGDVFVAYRVFVSGVLAALAASIYWIGTRWNQNRWAAAAGAILAIMAPYTLRTIFSEGNLPRALVILTLPWIIWWSDAILTRKQVGGKIIGLALLWALALTAHVMQAAMFVIVIGLFVVIRVLTNVYIPLRRVPLALLPVAFGGVLAAFYLLPAYSHIELANVPYLPISKIDLFSITLSALNPVQTELESLHIGSLSLLLAFVVVWISRKSEQWVFFALALITIVFAAGNASVIYRALPLNQMFLPERFMNAAAILVPLAVATAPLLTRRHALVLGGGLLLVVLIEFTPAWRMIHMRPAPVDEQAIAQELATQTLPGRIASLTEPSPTAPQIYLTSEIAGRDHISGWGLENTPHQDAIRRLLAGMARSPDYVQRMLSLWQSDYALTRPDDGRTLDNFEILAQSPSLTLWGREKPTSFAQALPDNRMLIIGQNATSWLFAFPFATEGAAAKPSAYSADYLRHFSVIGLNRFSGPADGLYDWVAQGNTLVVDLSGYDPIFNQGYSLFGVHSLPLALYDTAAIEWSDDFENMPALLAVDELPWVGATYQGLDEVVASVRYHGMDYPLIGKKRVGNGEMWCIGFNLLYWLDITGQQQAIARIVDVVLRDSPVDRSLTLPPLAVSDLTRQPDQIAFRVAADQPTTAVLSMTYFPRWTLEINGQPAPMFNHEHLIGINLPAGQSQVALRYHPYSTVSLIGAGVSVLGLAALAVITYGMQRRPVLALQDRENHFFDRHASHAIPAPPSPEVHTECPACGYEYALIGPPTESSYPFVSITCPKCGYEL